VTKVEDEIKNKEKEEGHSSRTSKKLVNKNKAL
jgi:hypothetical protein